MKHIIRYWMDKGWCSTVVHGNLEDVQARIKALTLKGGNNFDAVQIDRNGNEVEVNL